MTKTSYHLVSLHLCILTINHHLVNHAQNTQAAGTHALVHVIQSYASCSFATSKERQKGGSNTATPNHVLTRMRRGGGYMMMAVSAYVPKREATQVMLLNRQQVMPHTLVPTCHVTFPALSCTPGPSKKRTHDLTQQAFAVLEPSLSSNRRLLRHDA